MRGYLKITGLFLIFLWSIDFQGQEGFSQTSAPLGQDLPVKMGGIDFQIKEFAATPSPIPMLEIQIEIINPSLKGTIPPNTVKVIAIPKEVRFSSSGPASRFNPPPEEATLTLPIPPGAVRIVMMGFSLPPEKLESISFEVQINPPDGETKTATFHF
jgi:hypothetical protein